MRHERNDRMLSPPDPRPSLGLTPDENPVVQGCRCTTCAWPWSTALPRCPRCGADTVEASFGPDGVVWASTVVRMPIDGRTLPYGLAYVDLSGGVRVLAHATGQGDRPLRVGVAVRITGLTGSGDLAVKPV